MSAKDFFDIFVPSADATKEALVKWRTTVGIGMFLGSMALICLYTIKANSSEVDDLKVAVYIPAMEKAHERYCLTDNPDTRALLRRQVNKMQLVFRDVTGDKYPLEDCDEIRRQSGV